MELKREMNEKQIVITEQDRKRLIDLILDAQSGEYRGSIYLDQLRGELHRAQIVAPQDIPADTITMNSKVALLDLDTQEEEIYTLVYPETANSAEGKISILAPLATALLGRRLGEEVEFQAPGRLRRLRVEDILYQPESAGDLNL